MSLASDIQNVFDSMIVPPSGDEAAARAAKTDEWMCQQLSSVIVTYFEEATITASATVTGGVPSGAFTAGTGTASGWSIEDIASQLLDGCYAGSDVGIANAWGSAVENAGMAATCDFPTITGSVTTPAGVTMPLSGPAKGTVSGASTGTCGPAFLVAFNAAKNVASGGDGVIAQGMAAAITAFVASMQCLVTGNGSIAGATGTGTTSPGA